ncbi:MAG TPA: thioredoxin-like domain-containing protein [Bacteroidales bacterium]|nr:thioredoxin-like domain-containing protein [Bacteroidales bacterium]HOL98105.1 thioredoxin-like domain-containing protein [Bacteroidales bacterium]HOM36214.1 thioredoxin-like domain-containing protein [Bacteroidales bacterium]HPD23745.1 thioredoxin-like domain-containing protein [Bacteroidales bacterium]HRS99777.1 thioredoxin-like domain-containing protein [Bacteroidales bacterium]
MLSLNNIKKVIFVFGITFFIGISIFFISSCKNKNSEVVIEGNIIGAENKKIQLEETYPGFIDTIVTTKISKEGKFKITLNGIENSFHRLKIDNNNFIPLKIYPGEHIEITATYPDISKNYQISGSSESEKIKKINERLLISFYEIEKRKKIVTDSSKIIGYNIDSLIHVMNVEVQEIFENDKKFIIDFIHENKNLSIIYLGLYQYVGISPLLKIDNDFEIFEFVLENLQKYHPDLKQTAILESEISKYKLKQQNLKREYLNLKVGNLLPDFTLKNTENKDFRLYSVDDKPVMIIFWASWSKTAAKEIPKILTYAKSTPETEFIFVSLDNNKDRWINAIKSNSLHGFVNVCDFKSWESPVVYLYGVKKIPFYISIDKNKKILSFGESFDKIINLNFDDK